ncbi:RNA polymerase sigma factor [Lysinibacillus sp. NPDC097287]|uniref:RNA polymerase sigma factor n=1 Tax=Lysinibacillus sp. NPDC097287 TaxID=3364144 RepID=UPI0038128436
MNLRTEELYELYSTSIYKFILLMVSHPETAEDLTQETYIRCHKNIQHFRGEATELTWLRKIARNIVYDYYKRQRILSFIPFTKKHEREEKTYVPHEWLLADEETKALYIAIQKLKFAYREAIILRKIEGYSIKETAKILGCSEVKVKNDTARGVEQLQRLLEGEVDYV